MGAWKGKKISHFEKGYVHLRLLFVKVEAAYMCVATGTTSVLKSEWLYWEPLGGVCAAHPAVCVVWLLVSQASLRMQSSSCAPSDDLVSMTEVSFSLLFVALLFTLCCFLVLHLSWAVKVWGRQTFVNWSYGYTCALILPWMLTTSGNFPFIRLKFADIQARVGERYLIVFF